MLRKDFQVRIEQTQDLNQAKSNSQLFFFSKTSVPHITLNFSRFSEMERLVRKKTNLNPALQHIALRARKEASVALGVHPC
jgi:hypothetical protein